MANIRNHMQTKRPQLDHRGLRLVLRVHDLRRHHQNSQPKPPVVKEVQVRPVYVLLPRSFHALLVDLWTRSDQARHVLG